MAKGAFGMFEWDDERALLIDENERKPNRRTAAALRGAMLFILASLGFNELGFFHIDLNVMRVCSAVALVAAFIPQLIAARGDLVAHPKTKYVFLACVWTLTAAYTMGLFLFTAPACLLPMLFAAQYNSRKFSRIAIVCTLALVTVAPPLSCVLGLWNEEFMHYLLDCSLGRKVVYTISGPFDTASMVLSILSFISLPWLMATFLFGRMVLSAARKGEESIRHQVQIMRMSRLDALTGLYNQNAYKQFLASPPSGPVGVLFFDVDNLKAINDLYGHETGDQLLSRCAGSLLGLLDERCHGFRVGGDEFLLAAETDDPRVLEKKIGQWRAALSDMRLEAGDGCPLSCRMSVGMAMGSGADLPALIREADERMYEEKNRCRCAKRPRGGEAE